MTPLLSNSLFGRDQRVRYVETAASRSSFPASTKVITPQAVIHLLIEATWNSVLRSTGWPTDVKCSSKTFPFSIRTKATLPRRVLSISAIAASMKARLSPEGASD